MARRRRVFSKAFREDPMRSRRITSKFEQRIMEIREAFIEKLLKLFDESAGKEEERKAQAVGNIILDSFLRQVDELVEKDLVDPTYHTAAEFTTEAYMQGYGDHERDLPGFAGIAMDVGAPSTPLRQQETEKVTTLISSNEYRFKGLSDKDNAEIRGIITDGYLNNTPQYIVRQQLEERLEGNKVRARMILRTETQKALVAGALDRYRAEGIERVEWFAAGADPCDQDFSDEHEDAGEGCIGLDGMQFNIDDAPPCPLHPNCLCTLLQIYPWEEGGTRVEEEEVPPSEEEIQVPSPEEYAEIQAEEARRAEEEMREYAKSSEMHRDTFLSRGYQSDQIEHAMVFREENLVFEGHGTTGQVSTPARILKDAHAIHNHPSGTLGPSAVDMHGTMLYDQAAETVMTSEGDFITLFRPEGGWPEHLTTLEKKQLEKMWTDAVNRAYELPEIRNLKEALVQGKIDGAEFQRLGTGKIIQNILKENGIEFVVGNQAGGVAKADMQYQAVVAFVEKVPEGLRGSTLTIVKGTPAKVSLAVESYRPNLKGHISFATASERAIANIVGGEMTPAKYPFDVVNINGKDVIEVKTIISSTTNKVTIHPPSMEKKLTWLENNPGMRPHLVVFDARDGSLYYREGLGSWETQTMEKINSFEELAAKFK